MTHPVSYSLHTVRLNLMTAEEVGPTRRPLRFEHQGDFPVLASGFVHEWFRDDDWAGDRNWCPPLTLLTVLALSALGKGRILWIGRRCWPTFQILCTRFPAIIRQGILTRSVFLDPLTDEERYFAIAQGLRCPGLACVVADGSGMNGMTSRRLQLAAETHTVLGLLARPVWEINEPSCAASRWRVRPRDSSTGSPQWDIELHSCRGQPEQDAPRRWASNWDYQVFRGTGALHFSSDLGCGSAATPIHSGQSKTA